MWKAVVMAPVLELRKEVVDVLVRGSIRVESEQLENKTRWLKRGEEGQVFVFWVDGRRGGDIIESK
jgi:hypothetical protein